MRTNTAKLETADDAWREWYPSLDNDHLTLGEIYETLPGAEPECIHFIVRLLENPASPVALPGAVNLPRHDAIHILLCRGLLGQDEAFVIGYTMGTSKTIWDAQVWAFKKVARHIYPGIYRMSDRDLLSFDLGFGSGIASPARSLYRFPFEDRLDQLLGNLRREAGINTQQLRATYRHEQRLLPDTVESRRLPVRCGTPRPPLALVR